MGSDREIDTGHHRLAGRIGEYFTADDHLLAALQGHANSQAVDTVHGRRNGFTPMQAQTGNVGNAVTIARNQLADRFSETRDVSHDLVV
ncbi:hypothetical protein D3C76_1045140 [compost metagenome]